MKQSDRQHLFKELQAAADAREFVLHYQPQVCLRTGSISGAEALLRWRHPTRGLLEPAAFIESLERHPAAREVGTWVINEACRQNSIWRARHLMPIPIAVNLFQAQLASKTFYYDAISGVRQHGLPMDALELELTERIVLDELEEGYAAIHSLNAVGIRFALDDFGTGYAAFDTLKKVPVNRLKIDRGFISRMSVDARDNAIVHLVVKLARELDLSVVAEGVETLAQEIVLRGMGCHMGQGRLYSEPLPPEEFGRLLKAAVITPPAELMQSQAYL